MILSQNKPPFDLVVKLLYRCGFRLFECLNLCIQCLTFDAGKITIHDGKGKIDRTVLLFELKTQLDAVKELHRLDLAGKYAGGLLVTALDKKYPNVAKEFVWQWLFPALDLIRVPATGEYKRYHLHATVVQKAIKEAVRLRSASGPQRIPHQPLKLSWFIILANERVSCLDLGWNCPGAATFYIHENPFSFPLGEQLLVLFANESITSKGCGSPKINHPGLQDHLITGKCWS